MSLLQDLRRKKGLTAEEFSKRCNVSLNSIHQYEQGRMNLNGCKFNVLVRMCEVLDCDLPDLFEDEDLKNKIYMIRFRAGA